MVDTDVYNTANAVDAATLLMKQLASASLAHTYLPIVIPFVVTGDFDTDAYNKLPLVNDANRLFEKQLESAGLDRAKLFSRLAPLFFDSESKRSGPYAVWLIHRHFELKPGERMVEANGSTKPSTESSPNIVPHLWSRTGEAIEFRSVSESDTSTLPPPPSPEFFSKFRSILDENGIDALGICYAQNDLKYGEVYQEVDGPGERERVVSIVHESLAIDAFQVTWTPRFNPNFQSLTMIACCTCFWPGCRPGPLTTTQN